MFSGVITIELVKGSGVDCRPREGGSNGPFPFIAIRYRSILVALLRRGIGAFPLVAFVFWGSCCCVFFSRGSVILVSFCCLAFFLL